MKMLSHSSLALLSVVTIFVCGAQPATHVAGMAPASEIRPKATPWDFSLSDEGIAAAGLGGLDGAVVFDVTRDPFGGCERDCVDARRRSAQPGS